MNGTILCLSDHSNGGACGDPGEGQLCHRSAQNGASENQIFGQLKKPILKLILKI
jgi:hypothetical protein